MIFARRDKAGPDPLLHRKVQLFFGGALLALVGIAMDSSLLVGLAIFILVVGALLRFLPGWGGVDETESPGEEEPDAGQRTEVD